MEKLLDLAPVLCFSASAGGIILDVNDHLCQQLGYNKEELTGQKLELIFTLPTRIFHQTHFFPLLKMQLRAEEIYITLLTKTREELPVLFNAEMKTLDDQAAALYAGIVVRHRKKYEDELIAAKRAAEAALNENTALLKAKEDLQKHSELLDEKMYMINKQNRELVEFNRVVTHDLQEPLRKLFFFSNLAGDNHTQEEHAKTAERIRNVSAQMRAILSGLQQYVWLTEAVVNPAEIDLAKLLLLVRSQHEKEHPGIEINLATHDLPVIYADREQLHFLFHEIIANAIRFRKEPASVKIEIQAETLLQNKFRSLTGKYKYNDYLRLQIKDNGLGFDAAYKEQALSLFKRLHKSSGRGIGLSLCKKIVENHQGSISIDSKTDEGTTVTVILPLPEGKASESHAVNDHETQKITGG